MVKCPTVLRNQIAPVTHRLRAWCHATDVVGSARGAGRGAHTGRPIPGANVGLTLPCQALVPGARLPWHRRRRDRGMQHRLGAELLDRFVAISLLRLVSSHPLSPRSVLLRVCFSLFLFLSWSVQVLAQCAAGVLADADSTFFFWFVGFLLLAAFTTGLAVCLAVLDRCSRLPDEQLRRGGLAFLVMHHDAAADGAVGYPHGIDVLALIYSPFPFMLLLCYG